MGWLAGLGGLLSGVVGDIAGNSQNKANQKNADNQSASARAYDTQALQTALNNYASYLAANPSPASQYGNIKAPTSLYGGQTQISSPTSNVQNAPSASGGGAAPGGSGMNSPQVQQLIAAMMKQGNTAQQVGQQNQGAGNQFTAGALQAALNSSMNGSPQGQVGARRVPLPANLAVGQGG